MLNQTKILVLSKKKLILSILIILSLILVLVCFSSLKGCEKDTPDGTLVDAPAAPTNTKPVYNPGIYSASTLINGTICDISVTVDPNIIKDVKIINSNETVQTALTGISLTFDDIVEKIKNCGSTNIDFDATNQYTYSLFLGTINSALKKAVIKL